MSNIRMLPSPAAVYVAAGGGARGYTPVLGTTVDVPDSDVEFLRGNGWFAVGVGGGRGTAATAQVGATAARPTQAATAVPLAPGTQYVDTTLGAVIVWDGASWRNAVTGASV